MNPFDEWFESNFADNEVSITVKWLMRNSFNAGYNQRSSEVAEDLRIFNNLMSYVDTEH